MPVDIIKDFAYAGFLLLVGYILRYKVPFLQKLYIFSIICCIYVTLVFFHLLNILNRIKTDMDIVQHILKNIHKKMFVSAE